MRIKRETIFALLAIAALVLSSCSTKYKDGTYTAQSGAVVGKEDEAGVGDGYGEVTITMLDNKVILCSFTLYTNDNVEKGVDFGKVENGEVTDQEYYNKAQRQVQAAKNYASQLTATGSLKEVSEISGASAAYEAFKGAVEEALKQAKK